MSSMSFVERQLGLLGLLRLWAGHDLNHLGQLDAL